MKASINLLSLVLTFLSLAQTISTTPISSSAAVDTSSDLDHLQPLEALRSARHISNSDIKSAVENVQASHGTKDDLEKRFAKPKVSKSKPKIPKIKPKPKKHGSQNETITDDTESSATRISRHGGNGNWWMNTPVVVMAGWTVVVGAMVNLVG